MDSKRKSENIKVLIVDDSAIVRKLLTRNLNEYTGIEIIGTAPNPYIARDKILKLTPDVLVLDVEMPKMDGITFLKKLMKYHPVPVLIFSSLTPRSSKNALEALSSGAVDVVCKPGGSFSVGQACDYLAEKIKVASKAKIKKQSKTEHHYVSSGYVQTETTNKIIALGASTGGVQALTEVITSLPSNAPGIVVVQHMPPNFTSSFATRLDSQSSVNVKEAKHNDTAAIPGQVLIAPGGKHMRLNRSGARYYVTLEDGEPVFHQKPSVEVLFNSVAQSAGVNAAGAILTGMGQDGAEGLRNMKNAGAYTIAQNEETCIVYGMPKAAIRLKACCEILPIEKIAEKLIEKTTAPAQQKTEIQKN